MSPWSHAGAPVNEDAGPIFRQVAAEIENSIVDGSLAEESQAPSSNELAAFHRINPATAAKGLNHLAADGTSTRDEESGCSSPPAPANSCSSGAAASSPTSTSAR